MIRTIRDWCVSVLQGRRWLLYGICQVGGMAVFGVGCSAALGHLIQRPSLYKWTDSDVGMATATALCLTATGFILFFLSLRIVTIERELGALREGFEVD